MKRRMAMLGLLCGLATQLVGQEYAIDWYTVDGGGGIARGGQFELQSTIGQPEAGTAALTGGAYAVWGGFWPGIVAGSATGDTPVLALQFAGDHVVLSWLPITAGFVLEQTDNLEQPEWMAAPTGNPLELPLPLEGATRFYRLAAP